MRSPSSNRALSEVVAADRVPVRCGVLFTCPGKSNHSVTVLRAGPYVDGTQTGYYLLTDHCIQVRWGYDGDSPRLLGHPIAKHPQLGKEVHQHLPQKTQLIERPGRLGLHSGHSENGPRVSVLSIPCAPNPPGSSSSASVVPYSYVAKCIAVV